MSLDLSILKGQTEDPSKNETEPTLKELASANGNGIGHAA